MEKDFAFGNIGLETPHTIPFEWERFDFSYWRRWMSQNIYLPITFTIVYVISIFLGKSWMRNREPYKLKKVLIVWNVGFALFSLFAFLRTFPDLLHSLKKEDGFYHSVCSSEGQSYPYSFWSWIGTLSKVAELGDTAFLLLKRREIIFLHWYHHSTAMLYTWYIFEAQEPCHRWLMTMNFFIHVLMYSYFAIISAGIKLPRGLAMVITSLQILQMVMGVYVNWFTWKTIADKRKCDRSEDNLKLAIGMYASYLILFIHFFYNSYFKSKRSKVVKSE